MSHRAHIRQALTKKLFGKFSAGEEVVADYVVPTVVPSIVERRHHCSHNSFTLTYVLRLVLRQVVDQDTPLRLAGMMLIRYLYYVFGGFTR